MVHGGPAKGTPPTTHHTHTHTHTHTHPPARPAGHHHPPLRHHTTPAVGGAPPGRSLLRSASTAGWTARRHGQDRAGEGDGQKRVHPAGIPLSTCRHVGSNWSHLHASEEDGPIETWTPQNAGGGVHLGGFLLDVKEKTPSTGVDWGGLVLKARHWPTWLSEGVDSCPTLRSKGPTLRSKGN